MAALALQLDLVMLEYVDHDHLHYTGHVKSCWTSITKALVSYGILSKVRGRTLTRGGLGIPKTRRDCSGVRTAKWTCKGCAYSASHGATLGRFGGRGSFADLT